MNIMSNAIKRYADRDYHAALSLFREAGAI